MKIRFDLEAAAKSLTIQTYGYKFGEIGSGYKFNADVRNVKAGGTPENTGKDPEVAKAVMSNTVAKHWLSVMKEEWTPKLKSGDKLSIGCSRGRHRSVAIADAYAAWLRSQGWAVKVKNRDISKSYEE